MKDKNFLIMIIGQIISLFGNQILRFALPLHLLNQTGSAALFGLISACCTGKRTASYEKRRPRKRKCNH